MRERPSDLSAAARASWLAALAKALGEAQRLTWRLGEIMPDGVDAMELYGRIEETIGDVQSLRHGTFRPLPGGEDPDWMNLSPWPRNRGSGSG